jgi:hypothetical protein
MNAVALALVAMALGQPSPTPNPVTPPVCEDRLVRYVPLGEHARARITVEPVTATAPPSIIDGARHASPQGTRWLVAGEPDYARPGPWNTVLAVHGNPSGAELLRATFRDHASYGVRATWLNEKLLFVQVWWGRIASSDLVIDVERGALLYAQDADLAAFLGPCEERTPGP